MHFPGITPFDIGSDDVIGSHRIKFIAPEENLGCIRHRQQVFLPGVGRSVTLAPIPQEENLSERQDEMTKYFEIGALLVLDGQWQKLEKLRILMGDEVSKRTKAVLLAGIEVIRKILEVSIEREKEPTEILKWAYAQHRHS